MQPLLNLTSLRSARSHTAHAPCLGMTTPMFAPLTKQQRRLALHYVTRSHNQHTHTSQSSGAYTRYAQTTLRHSVCNKLYRRQTLRPANFVHNTTQQLDMPTTHPQMPDCARPFWETPTLSFVYSEPTRWLRPVYDYPQQRSTGGLPRLPLGGYIH